MPCVPLHPFWAVQETVTTAVESISAKINSVLFIFVVFKIDGLNWFSDGLTETSVFRGTFGNRRIIQDRTNDLQNKQELFSYTNCRM